MAINELPLVSIGIPTYNRSEGYLREALGSACKQTYPNIEIIVSDNCSTDGTESYVKQLGEERIRYYKQPSALLPNGNFNFCLNQAKGAYFLLLHDDDTIDPDFVETCMKAADYSPDYALIRTGTRLIDAQGKAMRDIPNIVPDATPAGLCHAWFKSQLSFYFCSTLFNTALLEAAGGLYSKYNLLEDCNAIIELATRGKRLDIEAVKANYREHVNYLKYGLIVKKWAEDFLWLLDRICHFIPDDAQSLRTEGLAFFAALSYKRAKVVASPFKRLIAYLIVFKTFGFRHLPPQLQAGTWIKRMRSMITKAFGV
jgi:glycosyltransferase involved in cell wall biosynthesis